MDGEFIVPKSI